MLCSPLLAIAAGFAIENLFKNQQFKLAVRIFNPLVDGSNPSWPTNKIMSIPDTWVTDYTEEMVDALLLDKVGFLNYRLIHNSHQAGFSRLPS